MSEQEVTVGQLYYRVVKKYELPVRNHTHVRKKIRELEREIGAFRAKHYLATLLRRDIRTEEGEFKPTLTEALDPYIKRVKVEEYFTRYKPVRAYVPESAEAKEREARRRNQWND